MMTSTGGLDRLDEAATLRQKPLNLRATVDESSPRETMRNLPLILQPVLTWITGKPYPGQRPIMLWTPLTRTVSNLLWVLVGLFLSHLALTGEGPERFALPVTLLVTAAGLRALYIESAHAAVHHQFFVSDDPAFPSARLNRFATELLTALTFTNGYHVFFEEHIRGHHPHTGTRKDPDYKMLLLFRFVPGMSVTRYWVHFLFTLVSPRFHGLYLWSRLKANFVQAPRARKASALFVQGALLGVAAWHDAWMLYLVGFLVPLTVLYHVSSLMQMLGSEHRWGVDVGRGKEAVARMSFGRFLGDVYPAAGTALAKVRFFLRLLFVHLPARMFVLVGNDLGPAHDMHHRAPAADWPNAPFVREREVRQGTPGWTLPYEDRWSSLVGHMHQVFVDWSRLPRDSRNAVT